MEWLYILEKKTIIDGRELNFPDKEPVPFNFESLLEYFLKTTKIVRFFS